MLNPVLGLWQFLLVWAFGIWIERRFRFDLPYGYRIAIAFGLGEMILSYALFGLGLIGGLRFWVLVPLSAVGTVVFFPGLFRELRLMTQKAYPYLRENWLMTSLIALLFGIYILGASVPEREVDVVWYHLAVPLYYINHGGFIQWVPFNLPSHYPMNVHLHYVFSLLVGNEITAKYFMLLHFIPAMILFAAVAARYVSRKWVLFPIIMYLSCLQFRLPVMANVQKALFFYVFLSTVLLWRALEKEDWPAFLLASLFCGMAMGTKMNALLFAWFAQWALIAIWLLFLRNESLWAGIKKWVVHSLIAWAMLSPWLIKSWIFTGNPFYPMLGRFFPVKPEYLHSMLSQESQHGLNFLKSKTLVDFFQEIITNINNYLYNADLIFFLGISSVIVLLILRRKEWLYPMLSGVLMLILFTWMWGLESGRLFAVSYPVLIVMTTCNLSWIEERLAGKSLSSVMKWIVIVGLAGTFLIQKYAFVNSHAIQWNGETALSEPARRQWLEDRHVFSRDLFRMRDYLKTNIPDSDELYGYRMGYIFYLDRKYIISDYRFSEQLDQWLMQGDATAVEHLHQLGVKWVLAEKKGLPNPVYPDQKPFRERWDHFVDRYLQLKHQEGDVSLYRLKE